MASSISEIPYRTAIEEVRTMMRYALQNPEAESSKRGWQQIFHTLTSSDCSTLLYKLLDNERKIISFVKNELLRNSAKPGSARPDGFNYVEIYVWKNAYTQNFRLILEEIKFILRVNLLVQPLYIDKNTDDISDDVGALIFELFDQYNSDIEYINGQNIYNQRCKSSKCNHGFHKHEYCTPLENDENYKYFHDCDTCVQGYHKDIKNKKCIINECFCDNGKPNTGPQCSSPGLQSCETCDKYYHKEQHQQHGQCKLNKCICKGGYSVNWRDCAVHGSHKCESCYQHYGLFLNFCIYQWKQIIRSGFTIGLKSQCDGGGRVVTPMTHSGGVADP